MVVRRFDKFPIYVDIKPMPDGRSGVLLQFEHGFLITPVPEQVEELANSLLEAAQELRRLQRREHN